MRIAVTVLVSLFVAELLFVGAIDLTPRSTPRPNQQTQFYLWDSRYDVNDANQTDPNKVDPNQGHGKD
jgi:hypothetical protein